MSNNSTVFIGIDLGDKHSYLVILDQEGELIEETRLPTTQNAFSRKFRSIPACALPWRWELTPAGPTRP